MHSAALQLPDTARALQQLFGRCSTPRDADQFHARLVSTGLYLDAHTLLSLCASPPPPLLPLTRLLVTHYYRQQQQCEDPFLWNALLKSSSHGPLPRQALLTLSSMLSTSTTPDRFSLSLTLKACTRAAALREGTQIHALLLKLQLGSNPFLQNCLVSFYSRCGSVGAARQTFDRMPEKDSVSWNSMIDGYAKAGRMDLAVRLLEEMPEGLKGLVVRNSIIGGFARFGCAEGVDASREMFDGMAERDAVTWNSMIDGYVRCGRVEEALDLFEQMTEKDVIAWGNIVRGFMEIGDVGEARRVFVAMPEKDVVAWNIMLSGYVKNGCSVEALSLFRQMQVSGDLNPDAATLVTVLSAIAELGYFREGSVVNDYIVKNRLPLDGKLGVALIDMYAKCGQLQKALSVFEASEHCTVDHWNAMIGGLAIHGLGRVALQFFDEMSRMSLKPDDITFIGVLSACSHSGLIKEGLACFALMKTCHQIEPKIQHYGCIVDMLGRGGRLEEAKRVVEEMPMEPNDVIFRSLLRACMIRGNIDFGRRVAQHLLEVDPLSSSSYILLSNVYAGVRMWNEARKIRVAMWEHDLKKTPGCSWIELDGTIHEFVAGATSHPQAKEMDIMLSEVRGFRLSKADVVHLQN